MVDNMKDGNDVKPIGQKKVCIIGGGPSGTAVLRAFKSAKDKGAEIPEIVCFEKQGDIGGQWVYNWRCGLDENLEPVASTMYRYLWTNGPKENVEFADYTFMEHFKRAIPSYPTRPVMHDYIKGRIDKADVKDWIHLNTVVHNVRFDRDDDNGNGMFHVTWRNLIWDGGIATIKEEHGRFDYVFVCIGHYSKPNMPFFPGTETFQGRVLHSGHFKDAREFTNSRILVVGTSYSAEDIGSQCYKYGCKDITFSYRDQPMTHKWPEDAFTTRPNLEKLEGKTATFADGSTKDVDVVILATGFVHHYPFLQQSLQLNTRNRMWVNDLYNGIFSDATNRLMHIGAQDQALTFNMFDAQAWYARDFVLGRIEIPSAEEQAAHFKKWRTREEGNKSLEDKIRFQTDYVKELVDQTDYPSFDYEGVVQGFLSWERNKKENILTFRDKNHKSVMDGTMSVLHHTAWIDALDDSAEHYLGQGE